MLDNFQYDIIPMGKVGSMQSDLAKNKGMKRSLERRKDRKRDYFWQFVSLCFFCVSLCSIGSALDPDRRIAELNHTAWTAKDGAPSQISALAQTADGYLWIGSARGLYRFDGVDFEPYTPSADITLPGHNILALLATPDGGLWIAFRSSGLAFLKDGQLKIFSRAEELPKSEVFSLARDLDGRIWAGTLRGLALFDGVSWVEIGSNWNLPSQRVWSMFTDRDGTFWVAIGDTIVFLPRGSRSFQQTGISTIGVSQIAQGKDGRLWMAEWSKSLRTLPVGNREIAALNTEVRVEAYKLHFDRDDSLWMVAESYGVKRVRFPGRTLRQDSAEIESFSAQDGLTDNTAGNILEDREGNIWISSTKGLDRFSRSNFVPVSLPASYVGLTLLAGENGDVWVASKGRNPLLRISGKELIKESGPMEVASLYRDPAGIVWWGSSGGIWKQHKGRFEFFPQPVGSNDWFWEIFPADESGGLWTRLGDLGLVHFKDGTWNRSGRPPGLSDRLPSSSFKDRLGWIWLGYSNGDVCFVMDGKIQSLNSGNGVDIGNIKVIRGLGAQIWFGGETGLAFYSNGFLRTVNTVGDPFGSISGIVETADGALWLNGTHGIIYISSEEIRRLIDNIDYRVNYQLYNILDGMPGGPQMNFTVSTAIQASDGRIWFATDNGLTWIDPKQIKKNDLPPPVIVKSLTTDEKMYQLPEAMELPKGTENLRISYTALSLSVPERVRFKYRLEGFDDIWRDAGTHREAFFTNLGPGSYRFRVIASNNDGVWNEEGAILEFSILPMFYQTNWFLGLCVATLAFLALLGYRWRVRQVKWLLRLQFQERLAERTRIAQDLHDTLLQGFVSAKMQLFAEVRDLPPEIPKTDQLKSVYELLGQLIEEGRNTVRDLRASDHSEFTDFEKEFLKIGQGFESSKNVELRIFVGGTPRSLQLTIGRELLQIGHESLTNAFLHSCASAIEVEIEYGTTALRLLVRDNGRGIAPEILSAGRDGHWGLTGMRERAEKIKADIKILSRVNAGTEVVVSVPRRFAYKNAGSFSDWIRRWIPAKRRKGANEVVSRFRKGSG